MENLVFYGTGDELIKNVYQDDKESAREYERVVKYVEDVLKDETKKYKLTDETINLRGITLYRIEALTDFCNVKRGDKGGFVQCKRNLSQEGQCWVYDDACVYGLASVKVMLLYVTKRVCMVTLLYMKMLVFMETLKSMEMPWFMETLMCMVRHWFVDTLVYMTSLLYMTTRGLAGML